MSTPSSVRLTFRHKFLTVVASTNNMGDIMQTTISTKYQVVIPKQLRERLNLKPKQKLTVIEKDKMLILIPQSSLADLRGIAAGAGINNYRDKKDRF